MYAYCENSVCIYIDPYGRSAWPVSWPGYIYNNYWDSVCKWALTYAPKSTGIEYGAIIYRVTFLFFSYYFMGETYKGFKTTNWYTVINGLGSGMLIGTGLRYATKHLSPLAKVSMIGFAHTHPIGSSNAPSWPDKLMKNLGWIYGLYIFPIAIYKNGYVAINYF